MSKSMRWFSVLPAALGTYAYIQVVACLASFVFDDRLLCPVLASVAAAFLVTYAAARTAPGFRMGIAFSFVIAHWTLLNVVGTDAIFELLNAHALPNLTRGMSLAASLLAAYAIHRLPVPPPEFESDTEDEDEEIFKKISTHFEQHASSRKKSADSRVWHATTVEFLREPV